MATADVTVIGGGMAGIAAALRLSSKSLTVQLVDEGLPAAEGQLGGFAKFSGAKFSLPPAGMGLLPVARTQARLIRAYMEVIAELGIEQYSPAKISLEDITGELQMPHDGAFRQYHSIILNPTEVNALVSHLSLMVRAKMNVIQGRCIDIVPSQGHFITIIKGPGEESTKIESQSVVYAGGRTGSSILNAAGAKITGAKGVDVGMRIEFTDHKALRAIRRLGPDAKILKGNCRTFCLNVPGLIYHYDFEGVRIPGGVVAEQEVATGNVGILCRVRDKIGMIERVRGAISQLPADGSWGAVEVSGTAFGDSVRFIEKLFGPSVAEELQSFCDFLEQSELVPWTEPHTVHSPLIDWHWDTFGQSDSFCTSIPNLYAIGDVSGHARGLLQAAVSGWLLGEDILQ